MVHAIGDGVPDIHPSVFIAWNAEVAGAVSISEGASVWFSSVLRADIASIRIGKGTNVQDGSVIHVAAGQDCVVGEGVTIGHRAVLHSCTVGNNCLIGMGSVILDGAVIGDDSVVGAGALVTQGKTFPPRSMIIGCPARAIKAISDEEAESIRRAGAIYLDLASKAGTDYREIKP